MLLGGYSRIGTSGIEVEIAAGCLIRHADGGTLRFSEFCELSETLGDIQTVRVMADQDIVLILPGGMKSGTRHWDGG